MTTASNQHVAPDGRAQRAYVTVSAMGSALETVHSSRPTALEFEGKSKFHVAPSIQSLTSRLFRARKQGSRFLSDDEWSDLESAWPFWPESQLVEQCRLLRQPWQWGRPEQKSRIILFDTRVLQTSSINGTVKHALSVLRAFLDEVPEGYDVSFLTSSLLPDLSPEISPRATIAWRPALIGDVDIYVQLATISHASDSANVDLLRAPWIQRISVFLDDIQGLYPEHFAGTEHLFWMHQLAIEKLRSSTVVLPLGKTSSAEAQALWSSSMSDEPKPHFITTSCVTSVPVIDAASPKVDAREVLVFGNYHPHKNLGLVACSVGAGRGYFSPPIRFTFLADLFVAQRNAISGVATEAAGSSQNDAISFASGLSDAALARRIRECVGVVIPSLHEGFSIPVIDVIALGTPVVLSRIPAHQELLPEGPWFFDPTTVASLETALRALSQSNGEWAPRQRAGLAQKYSSETLPNAIRAALSVVGEHQSDARTRQDARETSGPRRSRTRSSAQRMTLEELERRDREFISAKLTLVDSRDSNTVELGKPTLFFKNDHDTIVAEFHASLTWRVGKAVTAPVRWLKTLRATR